MTSKYCVTIQLVIHHYQLLYYVEARKKQEQRVLIIFMKILKNMLIEVTTIFLLGYLTIIVLVFHNHQHLPSHSRYMPAPSSSANQFIRSFSGDLLNINNAPGTVLGMANGLVNRTAKGPVSGSLHSN